VRCFELSLSHMAGVWRRSCEAALSLQWIPLERWLVVRGMVRFFYLLFSTLLPGHAICFANNIHFAISIFFYHVGHVM
jgi:hypothetical protein